MNIYDIEVQDGDGHAASLAKYRDDILLIVNTASKCGFTPQFDGLEKLYQKHKSAGLVILGFPCNQFSNQDPGNTADSIKVCRQNYGVTFPMMAKIKVNGPNKSPLYSYLKSEKPGSLGKKIKWNFTKFLVDQNGKVIKRYSSATTPEKIESDIVNLLETLNDIK